MQPKIFKILSKCARILQLIFIYSMIVSIIGFLFTIIFRSTIAEEIKTYPFPVGYENISAELIIFLCISAAVHFLCLFKITGYFKKIMNNFAIENYFIEENSEYSFKILSLIFIITIFRLFGDIVLSYLNLNHDTSLYNMFFGNYLVYIVFLVIAYSAYMIFKKGKIVKDDSESII